MEIALLPRGILRDSTRVRSRWRDQQALKRRRLAPSQQCLPGLSHLETIAVIPTTRRRYLQLLEEFAAWCRDHLLD